MGIIGIGQQRGLRRVCAYAKTPQSLHYLQTQRMNVDEDSDQKLILYTYLDTVKHVLSGHLKIDETEVLTTNGSNVGRKYCRMLPLEHSSILLTCIRQ